MTRKAAKIALGLVITFTVALSGGCTGTLFVACPDPIACVGT